MFSQPLHLVCSLLALSIVPLSRAQVTSTATENGIISAAGGPVATQSVSYSIEGAPAASLTSSDSLASATDSSNSDSLPMGGDSSDLSNSNEHGLSIPAILGITVAVVMAVIGIIILVMVLHKQRTQYVGRAKRKSIMDMEFAGESKATLQRVDTAKSSNATIGYFDIAKPLPAVVQPIEDDRLSRSSTIIGDAAEIAQINRKVSSHQRKQKQAREAVRERNHALQILITNEDNRTSVLPSSPSTSNPSTPISPRDECRDNDGDAFAKRPSKI